VQAAPEIGDVIERMLAAFEREHKPYCDSLKVSGNDFDPHECVIQGMTAAYKIATAGMVTLDAFNIAKDALMELSCLGNGKQVGNSNGNTIAFRALQKIHALTAPSKPETRILTSFIRPPIPIRGFDWVAWIDGEEEGHRGHGKTEKEAIEELQNLQAQFDESDRAELKASE
jgi:hypothetical protein